MNSKVLTILIAPLAALAADNNGRAVTFTKDIAPIFQKSCQSCHHAGTSAPMSLVTSNEARPWAKSIKERVARVTCRHGIWIRPSAFAITRTIARSTTPRSRPS